MPDVASTLRYLFKGMPYRSNEQMRIPPSTSGYKLNPIGRGGHFGDFDIHDPAGKNVGSLMSTPEGWLKPTIWVRGVGLDDRTSSAAANALGPATTRDLQRQLSDYYSQAYPMRKMFGQDWDNIAGVRASGARAAKGIYNMRDENVVGWTKFNPVPITNLENQIKDAATYGVFGAMAGGAATGGVQAWDYMRQPPRAKPIDDWSMNPGF